MNREKIEGEHQNENNVMILRGIIDKNILGNENFHPPQVIYPEDDSKKNFKQREKILKNQDREVKRKGLKGNEAMEYKNDAFNIKTDMENSKEADQKSLEATEKKITEIKSLAESLLNTYQTGVYPDTEYLERVADLATDFYQKHWHEQIDRFHTQQHQQRWKENIGDYMQKIINQLIERKRN